MDGKTLIDEVLRDHHGIDPDDAEYTAARLRTKKNGQRAVTKCWTFKNWVFRYVPAGTVTITANTYSKVLPLDFNSIGKHGSVVVPSLRRELDWMPFGSILRMINGDPKTDTPDHYSIGKIEQSGVDIGKQSILVYPSPSDNTALVFPYERLAPTLLDAVAPSGLEEIPANYHEVVKEGAIAYEMRDDGDMRFAEQYGLFRTGLIEMARDLVPGIEAPKNWPVYPGARRHYARLGFRSRI